MEKKKFEKATVSVIKFDNCDIIATSGGTEQHSCGGWKPKADNHHKNWWFWWWWW